MTLRILLITILLGITTVCTHAQTLFSEADTKIYDTYMEWAHQFRNEPINKLMIITAKHIANNQSPYVAGTLDKDANEQLVVNLKEFDCTTFIETCIALSQTLKSGDTSKENYAKVLTNIRYRGGVINGFASRLHYMSDWIYDGEQKGLFTNVSLKYRGEEKNKKVNFMSSNSGKYKQLKKNKAAIQEMKKVEAAMIERNKFHIISNIRVPSILRNIEDGDIIFCVTDKGGLDYSHMVLAYKRIDGLKYIHASSKYKEVVEENRTLYDYIYRSRSITGITIVRLN